MGGKLVIALTRQLACARNKCINQEVWEWTYFERLTDGNKAATIKLHGLFERIVCGAELGGGLPMLQCKLSTILKLWQQTNLIFLIAAYAPVKESREIPNL